MNYAIIYARVSSKDQEKEGYSIPSQLKLLKNYASTNNYSIVREFTDAETAKKAGRKEFNKMLKFIEEEKTVKHILVEKTDRLLRNLPDYGLVEELIKQSEVNIHLVKENVVLSRDSRSNEKFIFGIKALMAKNYSDNLSEEVKKGMQEKAAQGIYPSIAPYGYLNVKEGGKKILKVDSEAAMYIRKMFELYATGNYSLLLLRKKMITDGMVYRNGKNFYRSKVEYILKNEFYTGVFYWKGKKYENASHEPIIERDLFDRVQEILLSPYKSKSRKGLFAYTNLMKCGVCGCALTAQIKKEKYIYYHCSGYKGNCRQPYLKQEVVEAEFEKLLESIYISEDMQKFILQGVKESLKDKIEYHNNLVKQLEKQINMLQNRIDEAYLDKVDKKISEDFWQSKTKNWIEEKERLTKKLLHCQEADSKYLENVDLILELARKAVVLFKKQKPEQKRRLISLLVSNCTYKSEKLDIELKTPFYKIMKTAKTRNWRALSDYFRTFLFENLDLSEMRFLVFA